MRGGGLYLLCAGVIYVYSEHQLISGLSPACLICRRRGAAQCCLDRIMVDTVAACYVTDSNHRSWLTLIESLVDAERLARSHSSKDKTVLQAGRH